MVLADFRLSSEPQDIEKSMEVENGMSKMVENLCRMVEVAIPLLLGMDGSPKNANIANEEVPPIQNWFHLKVSREVFRQCYQLIVE